MGLFGVKTAKNQEVVKEWAAPSFTLTAFSRTQGCVNSLRCTRLCRIWRTCQPPRNTLHYTSHWLYAYVCWLLFFLTSFNLYFYSTMPSLAIGYAYIHIIKYMFEYIICTCHTVLMSYTVFSLARLKIALNILAHVPKSLLDPDLM